MAEKQTFLITVFTPQEKDPKLPKTQALAKRVLASLLTACEQEPLPVYPDITKLVFLAQGEYAAIVKALDAACQQNDERWLLAQVGTPCAASGLSKAVAWIQTRNVMR